MSEPVATIALSLEDVLMRMYRLADDISTHIEQAEQKFDLLDEALDRLVERLDPELYQRAAAAWRKEKDTA
jgi:hypothetical protein